MVHLLSRPLGVGLHSIWVAGSRLILSAIMEGSASRIWCAGERSWIRDKFHTMFRAGLLFEILYAMKKICAGFWGYGGKSMPAAVVSAGGM